jgi:peptidoglycan/LPS O-acetylase OafA/YrhL
MESSSQNRIRGLDGLRGIAVLLVVLFHAQRILANQIPLIRFFDGGWCGVDMFFVLSGFLITGILRATRTHPHYWKTFAIRRALRIFPLYYLVLALIILPRLALGLGDGQPYWIYPLFLSNFWIAQAGGENLALDITWSLSIEEQFYLLWPMIVWATGWRNLTWVCVTLVVAAPVLRFWLHDPSNEVSYMWTVCRIDALAWGALASIAWERRSQQLCDLAARIAPWGAMAWVLLLSLYGDIRSVKVFAVVGFSIFPALIAAIVLAVASGRLVGWNRVLEWRPLAHLGKVSYGAYLLHPLVIAGLHGTMLLGHPLLGMLAATLITWGSASLIWRRLESPILAKKDQLAPY